MRIALLCDVDQAVYHVGDELIATAQTQAIRDRGHEVVRISRRESWWPRTEEDHPELIPALTSPWGIEDRTRYLGEIRGVLAGREDALNPADKLFGIIDRMRTVDALVIGGGGSLNSRYGWLLAERLATALVARHLGKPVVLSGQSLGPAISVEDRALLAELLELCDIVGVRDDVSFAIARTLAPQHPRLHRIADEALALDLRGDAEEISRISVTAAADFGPFPTEPAQRVLAAAITRLQRETGLGVDLAPHMGTRDGGADVDAHRSLAELLDGDVCELPIQSDLVTAQRTASSAFVVTTRFHPTVFAIAGASGLLALPLDRYGRARIDGALGTVGVQSGSMPFAALWDPTVQGLSTDLDRHVAAAVEAAPLLRELFAQRAGEVRAGLAAWWDSLIAHLEDAHRGELAQPVQQSSAQVELPRFDAVAALPAAERERLAPWTGQVHDPSVAIVMRTKNRGDLLDRAVQDVLAQTRGDWELLIVNDAGDPRPVDEVIARWAFEAKGRVTALHRESSSGMEAASNAGIRATTAPLIAIHDDDDTWDPLFLQETGAVLAAHPEQLAVSVRTIGIHERATAGGMVEDHRWESWSEISGFRLLEHIEINRTVPIAVLHRRIAHDLVGLYDEDLPVVGDYEFNLRILSAGEVGFIDRPLAYWRHRLSATGAESNSIFARADDHTHFDRLLRERHLQEWVRSNGIGLPMFMSYLARHEAERAISPVREQLDRIEAKLDALAAREEQRARDDLPRRVSAALAWRARAVRDRLRRRRI